jgi:hypothetical protein
MNPSHIRNIVIKPGPARRVDPGAGPVRVCQKTGQCNDPVKPGRPGGSIRYLGETQPRPGFFFSNGGFETHWYIYTLCSQEKNYVFSM